MKRPSPPVPWKASSSGAGPRSAAGGTCTRALRRKPCETSATSTSPALARAPASQPCDGDGPPAGGGAADRAHDGEHERHELGEERTSGDQAPRRLTSAERADAPALLPCPPHD